MEGLPDTIQRAKRLSGLIDILHGLDLVLRELALALLSTLAHLALEESLKESENETSGGGMRRGI